ncbi:MAG TPA: hypothetical protein VFE51_02855 [Verrucomicrobiae bacterium]|nr:hypothetical protein [Verrucomicrobiae bacterium]
MAEDGCRRPAVCRLFWFAGISDGLTLCNDMTRAPAFIFAYPRLGWSLILSSAIAGFFLIVPVIQLLGAPGNTLSDCRKFGIPIVSICGVGALLSAFGRFKRQCTLVCAAAVVLFSCFLGWGAFLTLWAIVGS